MCTTCDALVLGKNISDFILFYLVPAISALFFIYAGFLILLGGGITTQVAKGRAVFETTVKGLLIIFLAWMIVNTVLRTVAGDENIAENWWKLECRETITTSNGSGGGNNIAKKYTCQNNQCAESATGTYTEPTCNNSCGLVTVTPVTLTATPAIIQACNVPPGTSATDPRIENCQKLTISLSGLDVAVNYRLSRLKTGTSQPQYDNLPAVEGETDVFEIVFYNNENGQWSIHLEDRDTGARVSNQVPVTVTPASGASNITISVSAPTVRVTTPPTSLTFTVNNLPASSAGTSVMTKNGTRQPDLAFNTDSQGKIIDSVTGTASNDALKFRADPGDEGNWTLKVRMPDGRESNTVSFTVTPASGTGLVCRDIGVNLCQPSTVLAAQFPNLYSATTCAVNACNQYSASITKAAAATPINGVITAALIRAIMFNESSCNVIAKSNSEPPSCGLMQLQAATANRFKSPCGVSANITCDWLTSSVNAEASICIAAKYLKSIASGTCGTQIRNIAAGYNGGVGACNTSRDCANQRSCDNSAVRRWECLYDNSQRTVCNIGYNETRTYAPKVLACYNVND